MSWDLAVESGVAILRFSHPPLHTATYADLEELEALLPEASEAASVAVLTGATPEVFIAHAGLDDLLALRGGGPTSGDGSAWGRVLRVLDQGPMVTIAAINGRAWGGGAEMAMTCNLRWMADDATLGFPEVGLGIIPGVGAHRVVRALPEHLALEVLVGGRAIPAQRALELHLVNGVVPGADLMSTVLDVAAHLARQPRQALQAIRDLIVASRDDPPRQLQRRQLASFVELLGTETAADLVGAAVARYQAGEPADRALGFGGGVG